MNKQTQIEPFQVYKKGCAKAIEIKRYAGGEEHEWREELVTTVLRMAGEYAKAVKDKKKGKESGEEENEWGTRLLVEQWPRFDVNDEEEDGGEGRPAALNEAGKWLDIVWRNRDMMLDEMSLEESWIDTE